MLPCPSLHNDSISVEWGNEAVRIVSVTGKCMCNTFVKHLNCSNICMQEDFKENYNNIE